MENKKGFEKCSKWTMTSKFQIIKYIGALENVLYVQLVMGKPVDDDDERFKT